MRTLDDISAFVLTELGAGPASPPAVGSGPAGVAESAEAEPVEPAGVPHERVELVAAPAVDVLDAPYGDNPVAVLIVADGAGADVAALTDGLAVRGFTARTVSLATHPAPGDGADPLAGWDAAEVERRLAAAFDAADHVDVCLLVAAPATEPTEADDWSVATRWLAEAVLVAKHAAGPLTRTAERRRRAAFAAITRLDGGLGLRGEHRPGDSLVGGVGGVVKTLAREAPSLFCRAIDIAPSHAPAALAELTLAELWDAAGDLLEVGVDDATARWTPRPGPYGTTLSGETGPSGETEPAGAARDALTIGPADLLVVTGGARGVTADCVRALAAATQAGFVLLGRTASGPDPAWAEGVADADLLTAAARSLATDGTRPTPRAVEALRREVLANREIRATLDALAAAGSEATYLAVDIGDRDQVLAALAPYRGRATGVVHGAGALADSALAAKSPDEIRRVLTPKLTGLRNVLDALADDAGDGPAHLVLFASVAGLMGNPGQADYAAANEALCRAAAAWKRAGADRHVTAIDWGAWDGGMVDADLRELFLARGVALIDRAAGAAAFVDQFRAGHARDVCVLVGSARALTGGAPAPRSGALAARRDLTGLPEHPVVRDHQVGAFPVLPATFVLGWLAHVVQRAHPGMAVVETVGFEVHKGVVFDGTADLAFEAWAEPGERAGDRLTVRAGIRGPGRLPRYAARLVLAPAGSPPAALRAPGWAELDAAWTAAGAPGDGVPGDGVPSFYTDGTLFHGSLLQGVRRVLLQGDDQLVVECELAGADVARGAFGTELHDPVLMDLLLQAPVILGRQLFGLASLPLAVGRVEYLAPLPAGTPFAVVVDGVQVRDTGLTGQVTAVGRDGRVLVRLHDVAIIGTPDMATKFREGAASWRQEVTA